MARERGLTIPAEGRLSAHPLPALLGRLGGLRATGALDITRKKLVRRFVLEAGRLQTVVSNAREDRFLDWLLAKGDLADVRPDALAAAMAALGEQPLTAGPLVGAGFLPRGQVVQRLRDYLFELLSEAADWGDATFAIQPGRADLGDEPVAAWPAAAVAVKLARSEPRGTAPARLPHSVELAAHFEDPDELGLDEAERDVLAACTTGLAVSALGASRRQLRPDQARSALGTLLRAGLLVPVAREVGIDDTVVTEEMLEKWLAAAAAEDFGGLLGVSPGADEAAVRKAYYRTVRRFHPDRFRDGALSSRHREVEQAFRLVNEALALLTDPKAAAERDERLRRRQAAAQRDATLVAAEQFERARNAAAAGRRLEAVTLLTAAVVAAPDEPVYSMHLALLLLGNPARRFEALDRLARLVQAHPLDASILGAWALCLARGGRREESAAARARALAIDPREVTALALGGDRTALQRAKEDPFLAPLF